MQNTQKDGWMLILKVSALRVFKKMLNKRQGFCGLRALKSKILANKKKSIALALTLLLSTGCTAFAANYRVGYTVKVENVVLGTVKAKGEYYEILDEVKSEIETISDIVFEPKSEEVFNMELVPVSAFSEKEEIAENVKALTDGMQESYTITADGAFITALHNELDANTLLDKYLESFKDENLLELSYGAEILVSKSLAPADAIKDFDTALSEFMLGKIENYTVNDGDTIDTICESFGVSKEYIKLPDENSVLSVGDELKIYTHKPIIPIKTVEYIDKNVEVPYPIETKPDDSLYVGQTKILQKGVVGEKYLNAFITKIDGVVSEELLLNTYEISAPVAQIEAVGTKEAPKGVGDGNFIMPTSGTLTSSFGRRWEKNHNGIDIGAPVGTPIYAADNGVVVESEYQSNGYGNIVKIDHQNGFVSYYAHCSKLYKNVGDVVSKGDLIAAVGNTGRSTGPHLHFEIRSNDVPQNPYKYVK